MLNTRMLKNKIHFAISGGIALQWLSLFLSYQKLPNAYQDINTPIAEGGFPFKAFEYPHHPMGHDWPPLDSWPMFFLNVIIWIIVGFFVAFLFGKRLESKIIVSLMTVFAIFLSIIGIFYIMLVFD